MIPFRTTADLLTETWLLLATRLGAVPRRLIWDNEAGIGRRNHLAAGVGEFTGVLATRVYQLKAYDPQSKGGVEGINQYLQISSRPGRNFTCPADFNTQLGTWLPKANARTVRAVKACPVDLLEADKAGMLALPPVAPPVGLRLRIRLPRDYYVRVLSNDYSVDPVAIGSMLEVVTDLDQVTVRLGGRVVAAHPRSWGKALTITDSDHVRTAAGCEKRSEHRGRSATTPRSSCGICIADPTPTRWCRRGGRLQPPGLAGPLRQHLRAIGLGLRHFAQRRYNRQPD